MRTTVNLPDELLARAKQYAAATHRTLTSVLEEGLRAVLDRPRRPEGSVPVRLVTYGSGGLRPGVDLDDTAALLDVMESDGDSA